MALDTHIDDVEKVDPDSNDPEGGDEDIDNSLSGEKDPLDGDEELQQAVIKLYTKCKSEDRSQRLTEIKDVKQAEFYWAGRQYIWWSASDNRWNMPTQATATYDNIVDDMPRFEFVTNVYQARGLMVIAAVAGAPPRIRFFPEDADEIDDIETAEGRTKLTKLIERWNPVQKLLQEESYHAYTGGFICWYSRYVSNGEKYGVDSVQLLTQGVQDIDSTIKCANCGWSAPAAEAEPPVPCPQCGEQLTEDNISEEEPINVPDEGEDTDIPKGRQIISVYGALNCARPQSAKEQSQFHYFGLEEEIHYSTLRAAFEDISDEIKPGLNQGPDDVYERNARLAVSENTKSVNQVGAAQANLCTFVKAWFRPTAFWMLDDKAQRKKLLEKFPRGIRVEFTGTVFCKSAAVSMDDEIVTTHAMPGRGQHRPAIGTSTISVQDRINTFSNIEAETYEYGIPITYRASDTWDSEANEEQRAAPGLEVEVALRSGENISNRIMQLRADSVSPDMAAHNNELMGPTLDMLTGTYPSLTGAGGEGGAPDTYGQEVMQRDQAMGRMGIFYVNLKQAWADVMTISCRCFEQNAQGEVKMPVLGASGDFESESIDVTALQGEAEAYPEGDENFPELWNQQRATMMKIADSPAGQILMQDPENAELFGKLTGIPGLKIPGLDSRRKQLKEIAEMTKMPDEDDMAALTGPIAPMVEVDPETDDNEVEAATCKWWLNSPKGQKLKQTNPMGWEAVKEHKKKHEAAIQPPKAMDPRESVTAALKDMPPEAQAQWLEKELGIHVTAESFIQQAALEHAKKTGTTPAAKQSAPGTPGQGGTPTGDIPKPAVSGQ